MSQPPGQYGGQYGAPGQYGQPAPGQYGQPGGYGPPPGPGYGGPNYGGPGGPGGFGPGGYGQPPQKKSILPWVITAAVVVLAGVGVLLFFLLKDDDDSSNTADAGTTTSVSAQEMGSGMGSEMGGDDDPPVTDLPTGAEVPMDDMDPPTTGGGDTGEETITGSVELGAQWLVAVAQADTASAWALTDPSLQEAATAAAAEAGVAPEEYLVGYVYANVFEGEEPTDASLVTVEYDDASQCDVIVIEVVLSGGGSVQVAVFVNESLLVQDFGTL